MLSTMLFNLVLEKVMRKAGVENRGGTLFNRMSQHLAYADDVAIIARNERELEEKYTQLEQSAQEFGLCINQDKTKVMIMSRRQHVGDAVNLGETPIEKVRQFKYLGSVITENNSVAEDVEVRIA